MIALALVGIPLVAAAGALAWRSDWTRPWFLLAAAVLHVGLSFSCLLTGAGRDAGPWMGMDLLARSLLPAVSLLFLACAVYGVSYLRMRRERPNRVFVAALTAQLGLISLAFQARHLGLLWVAMEAATLVTVPLLHFNGTGRAFEATWKYLLVGGTGIALSLLGTFCLGYASLHGGGGGDLTFAALAEQGSALSRPWMIAAWVLLLTGYGTKMGLAPMHTWKPDAYGEAPAMVGAMLAGGMTSMAFAGVLRVKHVVDAAGGAQMTDRTLLGLGLFSMLVAALFLLGTPDFKRMLAYSGVEHMGILAVSAALGPAGLWAALYHVWNNCLTKGALFLAAGNLRRAGGSSLAAETSGAAWTSPISARLFVLGLLAITACPPFGPFFSELRILQAAFGQRPGWVAVAFLGAMLLAFLGMSRLVFGIVDGRPRPGRRGVQAELRERAGVVVPPMLCLALSLALGLAAPDFLTGSWTRVVEWLTRAS